MTRLITFSLAVAIAAPLAAQDANKPLGELLEVLPPTEAEEEEVAPLAPSPPTVAPGTVATTELPASSLDEPFGAANADAEPAAAPTEADAAWAAMQERRRQEVNAVEAPRVAELNGAIEARLEETERRNAEAQADYERRLAAHDEEVRRAEADHQAALERHRRDVARQRAQYEACLAGDRLACPSR